MAESLYSFLDIESYQFRVLQILPGVKGSIIECKLQRHALINPPKYDALSYCWGDETITSPILMDGLIVNITVNLEEALQHLREKGVEILWVDALCINQKDDQEKTFQVRNMKSIYAEAETTYSWLGNYDSDCAAAGIRFLRGLRKGESLFADGLHASCRFKLTASTSVDIGLEPLIDLTEPGDSCRRCETMTYFDTLADLCNRPYWHRRWVIQEITVASHAKIICGGEVIDFDDLINGLNICYGSSHGTALNPAAFLSVRKISNFRHSYQTGKSLELCETLLMTQSYGSKDKRDNIYALLGICSDAHNLVPRPSYQQTPEHVAMQFTRELIRHNSCLDIIMKKQKSASPLLPTWCPDWLSVDASCVRTASTGVHGRTLTLPQRTHILNGSITELRVQGVVVGVVAATTTVNNLLFPQQEHVREYKRPALGTRTYYHYGDYTLSAIFVCLLGYSSDQLLKKASMKPLERYWFLSVIDELLKPMDTDCPRTESGQKESVWIQWLLRNSDLLISSKKSPKWFEPSSIPFLKLSAAFQVACAQWFPVLVTSASLLGMNLFLMWMLNAVVEGLRRNEGTRIGCWFLIIFLGTIIAFLAFSTIAITSIMTFENLRDVSTTEEKVRSAASDVRKSSRRLTVMQNGILGSTDADVVVGDLICLIAGCTSATILRPTSSNGEGQYTVVGAPMICLNDKDLKRYSAWDPYLEDRTGIFDDTLMAKYKTKGEWQNFILV